MKSIFQNKICACFIALLCAALWGTAFPFIKLGYTQLSISENDIGT